jgi:peptidoglycan biosynthesis protein MviN/MurJ (putative lipid II flippase)
MLTPLDFAGLALASSLSATLNGWLLWRGLARRFGRDLTGPVGGTLVRALVCALLMGAACGAGFRLTALWREPQGTFDLLLVTIGWILVGIFVYAIASRVAGLWDRAALTRLIKK